MKRYHIYGQPAMEAETLAEFEQLEIPTNAVVWDSSTGERFVREGTAWVRVSSNHNVSAPMFQDRRKRHSLFGNVGKRKC